MTTLRRFLSRMDESYHVGRMIEWLLVCLAIVALLAVLAIASRNIDGDLDVSAAVANEQDQRVREAR